MAPRLVGPKDPGHKKGWNEGICLPVKGFDVTRIYSVDDKEQILQVVDAIEQSLVLIRRAHARIAFGRVCQVILQQSVKTHIEPFRVVGWQAGERSEERR